MVRERVVLVCAFIFIIMMIMAIAMCLISLGSSVVAHAETGIPNIAFDNHDFDYHPQTSAPQGGDFVKGANTDFAKPVVAYKSIQYGVEVGGKGWSGSPQFPSFSVAQHFEINNLNPEKLRQEGYTWLKLDLYLDIGETNDGWQEIALYSCGNPTMSNRGEPFYLNTSIEHGPGKKIGGTTRRKITEYFPMDTVLSNNGGNKTYIYISFGAHGSLSNVWWVGWGALILTPIYVENSQPEEEYFVPAQKQEWRLYQDRTGYSDKLLQSASEQRKLGNVYLTSDAPILTSASSDLYGVTGVSAKLKFSFNRAILFGGSLPQYDGRQQTEDGDYGVTSGQITVRGYPMDGQLSLPANESPIFEQTVSGLSQAIDGMIYYGNHLYEIANIPGTLLQRGAYFHIQIKYELSPIQGKDDNWPNVVEDFYLYLSMADTSAVTLKNNSEGVAQTVEDSVSQILSSFDTEDIDAERYHCYLTNAEELLDNAIVKDGFIIQNYNPFYVETIIDGVKKTGNIETTTEGKLVSKIVISDPGKHSVIVRNHFGDEWKKTITVEDLSAEGFVERYFGSGIFNHYLRVNDQSSALPVYLTQANGVKFAFNILHSGDFAPLDWKLYRYDTPTNSLQEYSDNGVLEAGAYCFIGANAPIFSAPERVSGNYTIVQFNFRITDEDIAPSVNKKMLYETISFCDYKSVYYAVTLPTAMIGRGKATALFDTSEDAFWYAYAVLSNKVESFVGSSLVYYASRTGAQNKPYNPDKSTLTDVLRQEAEAMIERVYLDPTDVARRITLGSTFSSLTELSGCVFENSFYFVPAQDGYMYASPDPYVPVINDRVDYIILPNRPYEKEVTSLVFRRDSFGGIESNYMALYTQDGTQYIANIPYDVPLESWARSFDLASGIYLVRESNIRGTMTEYQIRYIRSGDNRIEISVSTYENGSKNSYVVNQSSATGEELTVGKFSVEEVLSSVDTHGLVLVYKDDDLQPVAFFDIAEIAQPLEFKEPGKYFIVAKDRIGNAYTAAILNVSPVWDQGSVLVEPTCTTPGTILYTCSNGDTKCESIAPLEHNWSSWAVTKEPSCTSTGLEERRCLNCSVTFERREIGATDHCFTEWKFLGKIEGSSTYVEEQVCVYCSHEEYRLFTGFSATPITKAEAMRYLSNSDEPLDDSSANIVPNDNDDISLHDGKFEWWVYVCVIVGSFAFSGVILLGCKILAMRHHKR